MLLIMYLIPLILGLLIVQYIYKCYTSTKVISKLPGPPALPLIGHLFYLNVNTKLLWERIRKMLHDYYPRVGLWVLTSTGVLIGHPDDIQVLFKSKSNLHKAENFYESMRKSGQDGLVMSDAKKWRMRRPLIEKGFFHTNFKRSMAESTNKYAELLTQQMLSCDDESIHDVLSIALKFSFNVVSNTVMGCDSYTIGEQQAEEFINAFKNAVNLVFERSLKLYLPDWLVKLLPLGREIKRNRTIIKDFLDKIIEERQNYYKTNGINLLSDDLISNLRNIASDSEITKGKSSNELDILCTLCIHNAKGLIDQKGMFEELETLIEAGYDTTGFAISYTLLLLAENENEQNLARKEVTDIMRECGNELTYSEVQNLKYLDRCVKESLRLFPSVPMIGRKLVEDIKLGNSVIPRNTDVGVVIFDLHRDPNFWPDPNKFNPDRFLQEFAKDRHPYAYLPFGGGARNCIGQKIAVIQIKLILAHILHNFYLKPVDFTCDLSFNMDMILYPTAGKLRVKFIKIR